MFVIVQVQPISGELVHKSFHWIAKHHVFLYLHIYVLICMYMLYMYRHIYAYICIFLNVIKYLTEFLWHLCLVSEKALLKINFSFNIHILKFF